MSARNLLSVFTFILIVIILYLARDELMTAWRLLGQVNLWILALLIPVQAISYFAVGAMIFEYLKSKGKLKKTSQFEMMRMALELNFVNHALPSGGLSGFSYMGWRLKKLRVKPAYATMAQVVRFACTFGAYLLLLIFAVLFITIDGTVNRFTVLISSSLATATIVGLLFIAYIVGSYSRLHSFSWTLTKNVNKLAQNIRLPYKYRLNERTIQRFFEDIHKDYSELRQDRQVLKKPFGWAIIFNIAEISMFVIAFASLGVYVNPAMIVIAYGVATLAGFFVVTPGGAGVYEALMISFLASAGAPSGATIAAIVLARSILILGTIASGYGFYQMALIKYGKTPKKAGV